MAPKPKYALAVLGWSGSMIFERDLKWVFRRIRVVGADTSPDVTQRMNCKSSVARVNAVLIPPLQEP